MLNQPVLPLALTEAVSDESAPPSEPVLVRFLMAVAFACIFLYWAKGDTLSCRVANREG
jgi:hypothetical protein